MKKNILTVVLLFTTFIGASAQNAELQRWANRVESQTTTTATKKVPNVIKEAGIYLEKSANYQYAAIGCAGVGMGLAIVSSFIGTTEYKEEDYKSYEDMYDKQKSDRNLRKGLLVGAGVSVVTAICLEIVSINYKMKAGRSLRLYSTGTGGGLAYTF